jgi:hypothetical protein
LAAAGAAEPEGPQSFVLHVLVEAGFFQELADFGAGWVQDLQSFFWSEVNAKLESVMRRTFTEVHESARKHRTHMRAGAYCLAVGRVADVTLVRGVVSVGE